MKLMDHIEKLTIFAAIYRSGSVHAAARQLRIAQPSVSYSLRRLEEAIGKSLFHRSRQGVLATEAGHQVYGFYEQLTGNLQELSQKLENPKDPYAGMLRIATFDIFAVHILPQLLVTLSKNYPQLTVDITIQNSISKIHQDIADGAIDLGILIKIDTNLPIAFQALYAEEFSLFAPKKITKKSETSRQEVERHGIITFSKAVIDGRKTLSQSIREQGLEPYVKYNFNSFEAVIAFADAGHGFAILPRQLMKRMVKRTSLHEVSIAEIDMFGQQSVNSACHQNARSTPKVIAFVSALQSHFRKT